MPQQNMQELAHILFEYIKEVSQLKQQTVLDIADQLNAVFLSQLNDPSCIRAYSRDTIDGKAEDSNDLLIRFRKPEFTSCPVPAVSLQPWLLPEWNDYNKAAGHLDMLPISEKPEDEKRDDEIDVPSVQGQVQLAIPGTDEDTPDLISMAEHSEEEPERFEDDTERVRLFNEWSVAREEWVKEQLHIKNLRDAFNNLFIMYNQCRQSPDTLALMIGNGILTDKKNKGICHPIYLKQIRISLDSVANTLIISDTDEPGNLYFPLFSALEDVTNDQIRDLEKDAQEKDIHPLDHNEGADFLKSVTHILSSESKYLGEDKKDEKTNDRIVVRWNPVFFLCKRPDGTLKALEAIIKDLENGADIPGSLTGILGGFSSSPATPSETPTDYSGYTVPHDLPLEDEEILLPKPANREQMQIVRQIEHAPAVLVQGPPGTGKTHTIANLLGHFLAQGKTVLVTSHTSKALAVLKEKIPKSIQPLCVSMLGNNQQEMEESVNEIIEHTGLSNASDQRNEIERLRKNRHQTLLKLQEARDLVYAIRRKEFAPIVYNGDSWSPSKAAAFVAEHENLMSLIPGEITEGMAFPLTDDELSWLYAGNEQISVQDEAELSYDLPDTEDLLTPEQLTDGHDLLERLNVQLQAINANSNQSLEWKAKRYAVINTQNDQIYARQGDTQAESVLRDMLSVYQVTIPAWAVTAMSDGAEDGLSRKKWERLLQLITDTYTKAQSVLENQLIRPIQITQTDYKPLIPVLKEIKSEADKHGRIKLSLFASKEKKNALASVTIDGMPAESTDDIDMILACMELISLREQLGQLWDNMLAPYGEPSFADLGQEPEKACYQQITVIEFWLNWMRRSKIDLTKQAEKAGIGVSLLHTFNSVFTLTEKKAEALIEHIRMQLIPAVDLLHLVNQLYHYTHSKEKSLEMLLNCPESDICKALQNAIDTEDAEQYRSLLTVLNGIHSKYDIAAHRNELLDRIAVSAPGWAEAIRNRSDCHGETAAPEDLQTAWKVRQLSIIVDRITSTPLSEAEKAVTQLTNRYRKETGELASALAWYCLQLKIDAKQAIRQSLNGWKQTVVRIGRGTGRRAPALRAEARILMLECQKAIPAWIMPVSSVMNSIDPSGTKFDVIIIDEASQSDITAAAILYMGKKIIVVGDDEQVSPITVGLDETKIDNLMTMLIKDKIPNAHLWDARTSLYDIAAQVYHPLMLREHFRCVPDIIGYSNSLSYLGKIKPLREAGSSPFKTATISYRVNGIRNERKKTNEEEANAIVALIAACLEQPEYANKSFGVISMLGDEQWKLISEKLQDTISINQYENHHILCGNASNFQGDERDVIFLSLVDSNNSDGPLSMASGEGQGTNGRPMKQRYNVAVSRAKDQLWVVHSLDSGVDLKQGDMRRRLLEYVANPQAYDQIANRIEADSDSPFEAEVAGALISKGYHIEQQRRIGAYYIDMVAICGKKQIAIECDGERWHSGEEKIREDMERQSILERLGWKFIRIRGSEYYRGKSQTIERIIQGLNREGIMPEESISVMTQNKENDILLERVKTRAAQLLQQNNITKTPVSSPPDIVKPQSGPSKIPLPSHDAPPVLKEPVQDNRNKPNPPVTKPVKDPEPPVRQTPVQKKPIKPVQLTMSLPNDDLLAALQSAEFTCIDNRKNSGILWVIYESEKKEVLESLSKRYSFTFVLEKRGALATNGKPAWRVRTTK